VKKLLAVIFIIILVSGIIITRAIDPTPGYNPSYCRIWSNDVSCIITCSLEGLADPSGLYVDNLDLNHTYTLTIQRYYSIPDNAYRIHFILAPDSNPHISLDLPFIQYTLPNGSVITPKGWALRITYYLNNTYYQNWVYIYPENYTSYIPLPPGAVITDVMLKLTQPNPIATPPSIPDWWNIPGWLTYLSYVVKQVAEYFPVALQMIVIVGDIFLKLAETLIIVIPLSIIGALTVGIEEAFRVINFWFSLFKKLYELFMKVVHVIISLIQALKPV